MSDKLLHCGHLLLERSEEEGVRRAAMARSASAAQPGRGSLPDLDEVGRVAFYNVGLQASALEGAQRKNGSASSRLM